MAMGSLDKTTVTLIPNQLIMTQGADMPIFHITDWNLGSKTLKKSGKSGLQLAKDSQKFGVVNLIQCKKPRMSE